MRLHEPFAEAARRLPHKTALVYDDRRVSYAQLARQVSRLARVLVDDGVRPGDRVLVLLENGIEFAVAVQAVLACGAVLVPVNALVKRDKLAFLAADTRAVALLTAQALSAAWQPVLADAPHLRSCRVFGFAGASDARGVTKPWPPESAVEGGEEPQPSPDALTGPSDALAALIYTSGTTGVPKAVMLSHANIASAWTAIQAYLELREDDVIGLALPAAFTYGLNNLLMGLALGATVVMQRTAAFPLVLAETWSRERVTVFPGVPTLFAALLGSAAVQALDFSALRLVTNAAAALAPAHLARLHALFPHARFFSMYGLTECMRASYLPPEELARRPDSVGRGLPGQAHWLADEQGRRLPDAGAATGELVVQGPHVMQGYWQRPEDTARRLRAQPDGTHALHTGDVFRRDADGWLYFVSRQDDIIKTRGEKVAPREVENVIYQLDAVTGCAVVGVADTALGQAVKAYVTVQPDSALRERDIVRHCLAHLENYMAPKFVEIVHELPRTDSGKIRHASLR